MGGYDRNQRPRDRLDALRQDAEDLERLIAADEQLADARAYADRLEKVLALREFGACLGEHGDRCHHWSIAFPQAPVIPTPRRPPIGELIGKSANRAAARARADGTRKADGVRKAKEAAARRAGRPSPGVTGP